MSPEQVIFLVFAALLLAGAVAVVTMRNLVHAALCMAFCFFAVAGLFVLLEAPFLASVSIVIGIGAITILIIFAVMLTRSAGTDTSGTSKRWPATAALMVVVFGGLAAALATLAWPRTTPPLRGDSLAALGQALVSPNQFVLPFEIASVLLLAALIGSIAIAGEKK